MNFEGIEKFDCDPAVLWTNLNDMNFVSRAIPDVDKVTNIDQTSFSCRVRPRFSFLTGSLDLHFEIEVLLRVDVGHQIVKVLGEWPLGLAQKARGREVRRLHLPDPLIQKVPADGYAQEYQPGHTQKADLKTAASQRNPPALVGARTVRCMRCRGQGGTPALAW